MKLQGLKKSLRIMQLEMSKDKFSIFADKAKLNEFGFTEAELILSIRRLLSDEEKARLFTLKHFNNLPPYLKLQIIESISDSDIKAKLLENQEILSSLAFYEVEEIAISLNDENKMQLLNNSSLRQKLPAQSITKIAQSLSEEKKKEVLLSKEYTEQKLGLESYQVAAVVASIKSEQTKTELIDLYEFEGYNLLDVLRTFSDESKVDILLGHKYGLNKNFSEILIASFSMDALVEFIRDNAEFLTKIGTKPYEIVCNLTKKEQLDFVSRIEDTGLDLKSKKQILATLDEEAKEALRQANLPMEYAEVLEIEYYRGRIIVDFDKDYKIYRGLGEIVTINPTRVPEKDKEKLLKLFEVCPQIMILDDLDYGESTIEEYRIAEEWIKTLINGINPTWTNLQKIAFVDNAIGKRISYTPDYNTEVCNEQDARALWKIIVSGYGVCNGIAQVEQYILGKLGIEAEMAESPNHTFLKLKDIEIPNADGSISRGDTILDPTWNLAAHRYGAMPENFCKSYEEMRKEDIDDDKNDLECHKNDEALSNATLSLDEQSLRALFTSIGIADKEGNFPIADFIKTSNWLVETNSPEENEVEKQLQLLSIYYPKFATCNNSTAKVLRAISLNHKNFQFNKCIVNRVYEREDKSKRPVLYIYADLPKAGKKFYFADKESGTFVNLSQKEFEERFECYEMDMARQNGYRPWEAIEMPRDLEDLAQSSGTIVAKEGEGR